MSQVLRNSPEIVDIPEISVRSRRTVMTDFPQGLDKLMGGIVEEIMAAGKMPVGAPILVYYDEEYVPERVDLEAAFPVDEPALITGTLPAIKAARYVHVGPYDTMEPVYGAVMAWIGEQGFRVAGPMREAYPNDPAVTPPEKLITELVIPVARI
ncbi:MAG: GyrI-like domain-containing protein [Chitinophagales bacterium]